MRAEDLAPIAEQVGREYGLTPWQLLGHADKESSLRPEVTTSGGRYVGLLQMDRALIARMFPGKNPLDPLTNLRAGARYFTELLAKFGSLELALAAYNWGPGKVTALLKRMKADSWEAIRSRVPFTVRWYVSRVPALANSYRRLWEAP